MSEKQIIRLSYPDGTEDVLEMDKEDYDNFSAEAKKRGISENELLNQVIDDFLKKEGY